MIHRNATAGILRKGILYLYTFCMVLQPACETNTDPNTMPPRASLEIFNNKQEMKKIHVTSTPHENPEAPVKQGAPLEGLIIRGTGTQFDKNMGRLQLSIKVTKITCRSYSADGYTTYNDSPPIPAEETISIQAPQPQGIVTLDYTDLRQYLGRITCNVPARNKQLTVEVQVMLTTYNITGKKSITPWVTLEVSVPQ
jgi:hypothetical protein